MLGDEEKDDVGVCPAADDLPVPFTFSTHQPRSYRDLPIRYKETSTCLETNPPGNARTLSRAPGSRYLKRTLSAHPNNSADEFKGVLALVNYVTETLGIHED